jgi:hypothetical protein
MDSKKGVAFFSSFFYTSRHFLHLGPLIRESPPPPPPPPPTNYRSRTGDGILVTTGAEGGMVPLGTVGRGFEGLDPIPERVMLFGGDKIWDKTRDRHGKEMNGLSRDRHIAKPEPGEDEFLLKKMGGFTAWIFCLCARALYVMRFVQDPHFFRTRFAYIYPPTRTCSQQLPPSRAVLKNHDASHQKGQSAMVQFLPCFRQRWEKGKKN